jgi:DNA recombination protein Rad52
MGFSAKQVHALTRNVNPQYVRSREAHGRSLSYLEGWYVISEANRIFGFDGWSRETTESKCIIARENRGSFLAVYTAKVRLTVRAGKIDIVREGHGTGECRGELPGEIHDVALKAAETDATKRALATFGRPFGLELYRKPAIVPAPVLAAPPLAPAATEGHGGLHPDDTTPIPRPSTFHGRERYLATRERAPYKLEGSTVARPAAQSAARTPLASNQTTEPSLVPAQANLVPGKIDKSQLTLSEPKRLRDKNHLKFVASQPCLICGRQPSDPHHLRFAQPRAIGMKVSDEFTVPLCRGHHRQLHQAGNELNWWEKVNIKPLETAKVLWQQTRPKASVADARRIPTATAETDAPPSNG